MRGVLELPPPSPGPRAQTLVTLFYLFNTAFFFRPPPFLLRENKITFLVIHLSMGTPFPPAGKLLNALLLSFSLRVILMP